MKISLLAALLAVAGLSACEKTTVTPAAPATRRGFPCLMTGSATTSATVGYMDTT